MATKKRPRAVVGPSKLAAAIFGKWARPGEQMPLEQLESELPDERRYDLVAALRELQKAGVGELMVGGKGHRSRFVWGEKAALSAARTKYDLSEATPRASAAKAKPTAGRKPAPASTPVSPGSEISARDIVAPRPISRSGTAAPLEHAFHVRPGVLATFRLPADITHQEVERLCQLLQSIPFR
ncbi:MAG: hypothetical protein ABW252_19460 [Polyangiales bacterium]